MTIELVPMLQAERDLYDVPRGPERFQRYLQAMTSDTQDISLPLAALNPMGKEHVAARLDALLALDAEAVAAKAVDAAHKRLAAVPGELRVGLVVADDAAGGWTERNLFDAKHRFEGAAMAKRGWAVALFWTSETPSRDEVHAEVLAAIYRTLYLLQHGTPRTLRQMMEQEGLAAAFAGQAPQLPTAELAATRAIIESLLDSTQYPAQFACLYGDAAAETVGYRPLGLPPRAGFAVAIDEVQRRRVVPESMLLDQRATR